MALLEQGEVGSDNLHKSLPTSTILWHELRKLVRHYIKTGSSPPNLFSNQIQSWTRSHSLNNISHLRGFFNMWCLINVLCKSLHEINNFHPVTYLQKFHKSAQSFHWGFGHRFLHWHVEIHCSFNDGTKTVCIKKTLKIKWVRGGKGGKNIFTTYQSD